MGDNISLNGILIGRRYIRTQVAAKIIKIKKGISYFTILFVCFAFLTGCGNRNQKPQQQNVSGYTAEFPELPGELEGAVNIQVRSGLMYFCKYEKDGGGSGRPVYYSWDFGKTVKKIVSEPETEDWIAFAADERGYKHILGRGEGRTVFIHIYGEDNALVKTLEPNEEFKQLDTDAPVRFDVDGKGNYLLAFEDGTIWRLKGGRPELLAENPEAAVRRFYHTEEGVFCSVEENHSLFFRVDEASKKLQELWRPDHAQQWKIVGSGRNGLFCILNNSLCTLTDNGRTEMVYLLDPYVNINSGYVKEVSEGADGKIYVILQDDLKGMREAAVISAGAEVPEKILLTFGTETPSAAMRDMISRFNRQDERYCVQAVEYSGDGAVGTFQKLYQDIINGTVPDLIDLRTLPIEELGKKGILMELSRLFEGEEKPLFLDCAWEVGSVGERIYGVVPSFAVLTAVSPASISPRGRWSLQDVMGLAADYPESQLIASTADERVRELSQYCLCFGLEAFKDPQTGGYDFTGDKLEEFLCGLKELALRKTEELYTVSKTASGRAIWIDNVKLQEAWENKELLVKNQISLTGPHAIVNQERQSGQEISWVGFPSGKGTGRHFLKPDHMFGISAESDKKEGALAFLRFVLSNGYQQDISGSFPVRREAIDGLVSKNQESDQAIREALWDILDNTFYPPSQKNDLDRNIYMILLEEIQPYCAGDKPLKETAAVIRNRAQLAMDETK